MSENEDIKELKEIVKSLAGQSEKSAKSAEKLSLYVFYLIIVQVLIAMFQIIIPLAEGFPFLQLILFMILGIMVISLLNQVKQIK